MNKKTANRIRAIWDEIESDDPDISTERLLQMVCDRAQAEIGTEFDHGDISDALFMTN